MHTGFKQSKVLGWSDSPAGNVGRWHTVTEKLGFSLLDFVFFHLFLEPGFVGHAREM
jgi:hypothetical protein